MMHVSENSPICSSNRLGMGGPRRTRYDYFLIWGNGLPYKEEILEIIRNTEFLEIIRIMDYRPRSIRRFVHRIYSYDYAPFQHLRAKTRYLLKTESIVTVILVCNQSPRETYRGEGPFRHIECERIKEAKEKIRNRYNPRRLGIRTEEHVIHASDNEAQVDHLLKCLGHRDGIEYLHRTPNRLLRPPRYLSRFDDFTIRQVRLSKLRCTVLRGSRASFWTEVVKVDETPQFSCLVGQPEIYREYLSKFLGGPLTQDYSVEKLRGLSKTFKYLDELHATSYILVREAAFGQYLVLDGAHRAAILRLQGIMSIPVAVVE